MTGNQPNNPLHGLTLENILVKLVEHYDWEGLAQRISVNCFRNDPSVKSSLKFLRKTPWAREQLEQLYLTTFRSPSTWPGRAAS
ncbi:MULTISPECIES: VF530 family protein [Hydrocarboniphaga]|uniref:VF530 family protein n=1 Tax=Hydrocarboniphaga TaxID=243627 RepID=UPI002ABC8DA1|nr:VF530 family protein [Hydrocarboniphaga sp.]MDZ4077231.1 VF530 family protein [Hydrocarboniphaga sp.]